ncbi:estradiol 17-beta-dehydrogenase 8 [Sitophilus oryzae]|uniref:(3R)-3-hydroxyacyl-CoA dehydrogenase n=1 Tax=Sitophilus oryzae TaxID=7048 RepID=A0A6J2Y255_SITOR|nr:estradiol 17-beta-dehydrogenase 8 [Sitophilus oryzae]
MSLTGRLAFVTGAGSGIGRATCQCLAREGALVIAADKNIGSARETVESLPKLLSESHLSIEISVENASQVQAALKESLNTYSRAPSIVVNAAGITRDNFISKLSEADFDEVLDVNLKGTFLVIQTFANAIVEGKVEKASIINIGSVVAKFGNIGQGNYCASKAGVELLTKVAAREFGKVNIRVNTVLPGVIQTPMFNAVPEKVKAKFVERIPLARLGYPEEVAEVISFLASDKSSYINGASIEVTGGF